MPNPAVTHPPRLPVIAPSILSADFANMAADCRTVLADHLGGNAGPDGADWLHFDAMDGHFVPNLTMGPDLCRALRREFPDVILDVHLMITDPHLFVQPFADAGADIYTFHIEPALGIYKSKGPVQGPPRFDPIKLAEQIRSAGMHPGLAINPPTPAEEALKLTEHFDQILVMSINPGFSGQSFMPETLNTTKAFAEALRPDQRLQMDGGVSPETCKAVRDAGCDSLVAGSAIFKYPPESRPAIINTLRGLEHQTKSDQSG